MTRRALLRASDAEREQIAERLRQAATEGRLLADELEERLGAALSAKTYGELDAVVSDLPAPPVRHRGLSRGIRPAAAVAFALVLALMFIGALAFAFAGHPHSGHHWAGGARGGALIWLLWVAIAGRLLLRRRRGAR